MVPLIHDAIYGGKHIGYTYLPINIHFQFIIITNISFVTNPAYFVHHLASPVVSFWGHVIFPNITLFIYKPQEKTQLNWYFSYWIWEKCMFPNGAFGSRCNLRWKAYWFGNFTTHQCKQTKHVFAVYHSPLWSLYIYIYFLRTIGLRFLLIKNFRNCTNKILRRFFANFCHEIGANQTCVCGL
jgi:hypothetical protein